MACFSIIVPVSGKNSSFEETLASVLRYRPENSQVIVAHCHEYDDPYGLGREVDFVQIRPARDGDPLIAMFNAGVKTARGTLIGFLRPGVQLTENWETAIEQIFVNPEIAAVSPALVSLTNSRRLIAAGIEAGSGFRRQLVGVNISRNSKDCAQLLPLGPTSWAAFYRKSYLVSLDDCDETLGSNYFDLDLALSFAALKFKCEFAAACQLTCENAQEIFESAELPHGCAAQRAVTRFASFCSPAPPISMIKVLMKDLLAWPWQWNNLKHQRQRKLADKFHAEDRHYQDLLQLLRDQRARIIAPGLHSRVAAAQRVQNVGCRRAA